MKPSSATYAALAQPRQPHHEASLHGRWHPMWLASCMWMLCGRCNQRHSRSCLSCPLSKWPEKKHQQGAQASAVLSAPSAVTPTTGWVIVICPHTLHRAGVGCTVTHPCSRSPLGALDGVGARRRRRQQATAVGGAVVADAGERLGEVELAGHAVGRGARERADDGAQRRHRLLHATRDCCWHRGSCAEAQPALCHKCFSSSEQ